MIKGGDYYAFASFVHPDMGLVSASSPGLGLISSLHDAVISSFFSFGNHQCRTITPERCLTVVDTMH